ncbi:unnamed protein product [Cuscuta europaea]|uniref:Uncharacterized protein n=1 Tax=Cuscuta europaea TaxID=41803 RepID=A0A9P1EF02_CUSEU|nr:unnamed protein product [Cuscuta europaea]
MGVDLPAIAAQMMKVVIFSIRVCCRTVIDHPFLVALLGLLAFLYRSFPFLFSALLSISPVIVCTALLLGTLLSFGHPNAPEIEREEEKTVHDIVAPLKSRISCDSVVLEQESQEIQLERHGDRKVTGYSPIPNMGNNKQARLEIDNDKSVDYFDSKAVNVNTCPGSPWKQQDDEEEDDSDDDEIESLESYSPDASVANIIPMLDELHPLLDEACPQPVNLSRVDSDEFTDGIVNQEEEVESEDDDDSENDEDDEESNKSAISWTEEDEKNVLDLGSSDLERNLRLEGLIAKRIAQKFIGTTLTKRNNINSEGVDDLPFNIAPISTARKNPFDIPDGENDLRLPPIPGSAPSVLHPRRNPFDLPYDSCEEKPVVMEGFFQKEFEAFQPKETFFTRHQSFKPSIFGQNKNDARLRPSLFVPERIESEGETYAPFQRQSSGLSDDKVRFVPETESTGLVNVLEGSNLNDKYLADQNIITDELISQDQNLMSHVEHLYGHVEHASNFSEVEQLELVRNGKKDIFGVEIEGKQGSHLIHEGNVADMLDFSETETNSSSAFFEQNYNWKLLSDLEDKNGKAEEKAISKDPSFERSDVNPHKEPMYNSSPISLQNHILFAERESFESSQVINQYTTIVSKEMIATSSNSQPIDQSVFSVFDPNAHIKASHGMMESVSSKSSEDPSNNPSEHNGAFDLSILSQEDQKLVFVGHGNGLEEKTTSGNVEELASSCPSKDHKEAQEPPLILLKPVYEADIAQSDIKATACDEVEFAKHVRLSETREVLIETVGEVDGMKDNDKTLLTELDGQLHEDNSVKQSIHDSFDSEVNKAESSASSFLKESSESNLESSAMQLNSEDELPEVASDDDEALKHESGSGIRSIRQIRCEYKVCQTGVNGKKEESVKSDASTSSSSSSDDSSSSDSDRD